VMLDLLDYRGSYAHWQSFLMVAAHAKGYSYTEVQTLFESRRQGKSSLPFHYCCPPAALRARTTACRPGPVAVQGVS